MVCSVDRWQAERRKHYPTAANQEKKAKAVTDRQARGELEPDQALRRQRLQEVCTPKKDLIDQGVPTTNCDGNTNKRLFHQQLTHQERFDYKNANTCRWYLHRTFDLLDKSRPAKSDIPKVWNL